MFSFCTMDAGDVFNQTEDNIWEGKNIVQEVTEIAEKNMKENGLIYSGGYNIYYDINLQCYYDAETKLYYNIEYKAFYYFDEASSSLKFLSFYEEPSSSEANGITDDMGNVSSLTSVIVEKAITLEVEGSSDANEKGICDEHNDKVDIQLSNVESAAKNPIDLSLCEDVNLSIDAPSLRVVVTCSDHFPIGTAFFISGLGGTIGRVGDHVIKLLDETVSKEHASISCPSKDGGQVYELEDLGSRNGTLLDGRSLAPGEPAEIRHGCSLTVGRTSFTCHVHPMYESCDGCEGPKMEEVNPKMEEVSPKMEEVTSYVPSLWERYLAEDKYMRAKYGLSRFSRPVFYSDVYTDRAELRRITRGSSHDSEKTEVASTMFPLDKRNKGFLILLKLGWKEGESLGRRNNIV